MKPLDEQLNLQAKDILLFHPNAEVTSSKTYERFGLDTTPSVNKISIVVEVYGERYNVAGSLGKSVFRDREEDEIEKIIRTEHELTLKILNEIRKGQVDKT